MWKDWNEQKARESVGLQAIPKLMPILWDSLEAATRRSPDASPGGSA